MHAMTKKALEEAFAGESMAHMKYLAFSEIAAKEGRANLARLFRAIAYAEQVHATNHARVLGYLKDSAGNLQSGIDGETFEISEMYPVYQNTAVLQGEKKAEVSTRYALEAEKIHAEMYADAKKTVAKGKDIEVGDVYICSVCGHTGTGDAPAVCPVCQAKKSKFVLFQ
jgi:rubrerythrin